MDAIQGGDGQNKAEGATSKAKIWITNMEISQFFFNFKLIFFFGFFAKRLLSFQFLRMADHNVTI